MTCGCLHPQLLVVRGEGQDRALDWEKGSNRMWPSYKGNKALLLECPWSQPEQTSRMEIEPRQLPPLRLAQPRLQQQRPPQLRPVMPQPRQAVSQAAANSRPEVAAAVPTQGRGPTQGGKSSVPPVQVRAAVQLSASQRFYHSSGVAMRGIFTSCGAFGDVDMLRLLNRIYVVESPIRTQEHAG